LKQWQQMTAADSRESPPVRGRGLKLPARGAWLRRDESPPVRGRGLKRLELADQHPGHLGRPSCGGVD